MRGTHRSLLQTGGRKEARFSSTQVFTLTGRSMVAREPALEPVALADVGEVRLRPAAHWRPSESATLGGGKGRGNPPPRPAPRGPQPAPRRGSWLGCGPLGSPSRTLVPGCP